MKALTVNGKQLTIDGVEILRYEELITVSASQLDMHNNAKTTILAE